MKNKPIAHKNSNRFQFKSFNEQLANVEIKYGRHELKNRHLYEDSEESKFLQTLSKWEDLNCTQDFFDLKSKIGSNLSVTTLAQIVHRKDHLVDVLKCCLSNPENKALDVALELVVGLAFDLRNEFYPFLLDIFDVLINLLDIQDSTLLENVFMCFAYLFKSLWRYMLDDFRTVLVRFSHRLLAQDRKEYIKKFAAQSFSFLIRKVDNKEALLELIFGHLKSHAELSQGFGILFFETMKGVHKQLHSCSSKFLEVLLRIWGNERYDKSDNVFAAIKSLFDCLTKYLSKETSETVWICVYDSIQRNDNVEVIGKLCEILALMIHYKDCSLVHDSEKLLSLLSRIINSRSNESFISLCLDCGSTVLIKLHASISLKSIKSFMKTIFSGELNDTSVVSFVISTISYVFFERDVLPHFVPYFSKNMKTSSTEELLVSLQVLVQIIIRKCHRPLLGCDHNSSVYPLYFPKASDGNDCLSDLLLSVIRNSDCLPLIWCALLCVPHIRPSINEECCDAIIQRLKSSITRIKTEENESVITATEFIILESVFALNLLESHSIFDEVPCSDMVSIVRRRSTSVVILQAFDFYLQLAKRLVKIDALDLRYFESLFDELKINLSSPTKSIRLLTLHVAVLFNPPLPPTESAELVNESIFQICLNSEVLPLCVEQYREKLRILQRIESGATSTIIPIEAITGYSYELVPIYSLLGSLYNNLSLLWSPINNIIDVYTRSLKNFDDFWRIILENYSQTLKFITDKSTVMANNLFRDTQFADVFDNFYEKTYRIKEDRPDHYNHRVLVLKMLQLLCDLIEKKNRDFVQWFFEFLENETAVISIRRHNLFEDITLVANEESSEEMSETNVKMVWRTLIAFLEVFAKFRNPKALYKERDVRLIFESLLQNKNNVLQKATFDCVLAYDYPFLTPYKENFLRLIDNKTFKSEIVNFNLNSVDEEFIVIKDNHRNDLMPYLMRILYGKMLSKTGTYSSGHAKSTLRRSIVFRFLAGCPEHELRLFFNLAFSSLSDVFQVDLDSVVEHYSHIDLRKCIPIRILLSSLKTLEVMLFSLGNITKKLLPDFIKILIAFSSIATNLLDQRNSIKETSISKLKVLRSECLKICAKFFEVFDTYNYSSNEVDVIFKSIVWPLLPLFSNESLSSPSPLLKLFVGWSQNPRYFILLMKSMPSHNGLYPLSAVMDLYMNSKCHQSVVEVISGMLVNLITLEDFDTMETETGEIVEKLKVIDIHESSYEFESEINYGTIILLPFIEKIVSRLKLNFDERNSASKRKRCLMTTDELTILTRISHFVKDEMQRKTMAKLLIGTFTEKQKRSAETDCQTLHTIYSLLKETSTTDPDFIANFLPLFRYINERNARLELCNIISTIVANDKSFSLLGNSISMINSYNPRNPEEPDYGLRVDGLKYINDCLDSLVDTENYYVLNLLIYNCCFFISSIDDLGVREVSSDLIQCIVKKVHGSTSRVIFGKVCIETLFSKEIRVGLKHKNENVRHEFLSILNTLVRTCHEKNPLLSQLYLLCDDDDELDFYRTIRHIQLHRRSRTLARFVRNTEVLAKLSSKVLSSYILPIATSFLFDSHCRKNSGLIDASIEAVGVICRHIEWPVYNLILTHYLDVLTKDYENHKMIVKILTTILNNFAYDLSDAIDVQVSESERVLNENKLKPSPAMAVKIYDSIVNHLLPKLHKHLHSFSRADYEYDAMKDEYPEDNEIQRVPLAYAIVKLLQALPEKCNLLESNIPSVFLRLLHFLKSKSEVIRETARNSLMKVMQAVGPRFFPYLLREMQSMLKKGYQVHVLTYTLHAIVANLHSQLRPGDFDPCLTNIVDICVQEIFSDFSEEKEISKIVAKVKEARKSKSFDTFYIVACFASEQSLTSLISPLKNILCETHSHKVLKKVSRCLQKITVGLTENAALSESSLLTFFYGIVQDLIPELRTSKQKKVTKFASPLNSSYLLLQKPARKDPTKKPKISSNQFILVQESLRILHILLKRDRLKSDNMDHIALLEPFVSILSSFVLSDHPKLTAMTLKCLNLIIFRFSSLQSLITHANTIKNDLFVLMHKHTGIGMQHGENYELVLMLFKTMHYLISEIDCVQLDEKQLEVLLVYAEKDIYENSKQAVAFSMLKAIISRRLQSPALAEIMKKLSEMLVQSESEYVRKQCVQIWIRYLLDFSHGKNLKSHLMFFIRQLDYEYESGRLSVLELLMSVVSRFPEVAFKAYVDLIFIPVASRLINEEATNARKFAADVLVKILQRSDLRKRNSLFDNIIISWFQQKDVLQKQLATRLCLLLAEVEQENFAHRLQYCIPVIHESLKSCSVNEENVTQEDHLLYHLLLLFLRILKIKPALVKYEIHGKEVFEILDSVADDYLLHSHVWVRVVSVDIFEYVFSIYSVEEVVNVCVNNESSEQYLLNDVHRVVWNLCLKFLDLLRNIYECEDLANVLIKNMVFIGKLIMRLPQQSDLNEETRRNKMTIKWLINRMLREIRREISENDKCTVKRILIFKWIAAIVLELESEQLCSCLEMLMTPLCREVTKIRGDDNNRNSDVIILAQDVLKVIQGAVGKQLFNSNYAKVVSAQSRKRMFRKNQRAIELLINPVKGLKRKHKKHVAFRENKKRKIAEKAGKKTKRRRV